MKILVVNDDSINAAGLKFLAEKAMKFGEVVIVAPKTEQSGKGHGITIKTPMKFKLIEDLVPGAKTYVIDSTPADCVRFATFYLEYDYDIVFSGVNDGYNLGEDIMYSGTVGGASEGTLNKKKGIAFSTAHNDLSGAIKYFDETMDYIIKNDLLKIWGLYNINFPKESKGIKITHQGSTHFDTRFELNGTEIIPGGRPYFEKDFEKVNSDVTAILNGFVSITPITVNRTKYDILEKIIK